MTNDIEISKDVLYYPCPMCKGLDMFCMICHGMGKLPMTDNSGNFKTKEKESKPLFTKYTFLDLYKQFDKRLNDPAWLLENHNKSISQLSQEINCSPELVYRKLNDQGMLLTDNLFGSYTGFFHHVKQFIMLLIKPYLKEIQFAVDFQYNKTASRNAGIFKTIIENMEASDKDDYPRTDRYMGYTRKAFTYLVLRFAVILYDVDSYYAERADYLIQEVIKNKENIYFDEQSDPKNWYPNRNDEMISKYIILRNR